MAEIYIAKPELKEREPKQFFVVVHGSYKETNFPLVDKTRQYFSEQGLLLLAPTGDLVGYEAGFAKFAGEENKDSRAIELDFLAKAFRQAGNRGFSYFVNPNGNLGNSSRAEFDYLISKGVPAFLMEQPTDYPVYLPDNMVYSPKRLMRYIKDHGRLPQPKPRPGEEELFAQWENLRKTDHAIGMVLVHKGEILVAKSNHFGTSEKKGRWTIPGQRRREGQSVAEAIDEGLQEELGIKLSSAAEVRVITVFDMSQTSASLYLPRRQLTYTDVVIDLNSRRGVRPRGEELLEVYWGNADEIAKSAERGEMPFEPDGLKTVQLVAEGKRAA